MSKGNDLIERLRAKLPGIQTPMMNGDNLAVTLCSHFDNPEQPDDETGWSEDAVRGYTEVIDAIHAHYASTIASLFEALAEAEKKGAEDWRDMASAPLDASEVILRMPKKGWPGYYRQIAHWAEGGGEEQPRFRVWFRYMADGYVELPVEPTGWMPLPPLPRDLSQGGQP